MPTRGERVRRRPRSRSRSRRVNAERLGLDVEIPRVARGCLPASTPPRSPTCPTSATTSGKPRSPPEISGYEPREAPEGEDGLDEIRALVEGVPAGTLLALEHAPAQAESVREMLDGRHDPRATSRAATASPSVERGEGVRGVHPRGRDRAVPGGHGLRARGRSGQRGSDRADVRDQGAAAGEALRPHVLPTLTLFRTCRTQAKKLLPGPITRDPRRTAAASGSRTGPRARRRTIPVLQTSANPSGGAGPAAPRRRRSAHPQRRWTSRSTAASCPARASTVVDLSGEEPRIVREGAVSADPDPGAASVTWLVHERPAAGLLLQSPSPTSTRRSPRRWRPSSSGSRRRSR